MSVDHLIMNGELGNTEIFDFDNYENNELIEELQEQQEQ